MSDTSTSASTPGSGTLERGLEFRHIQLIAIGGAIGTGLFMGSGKTISVAGPSILLVYMMIGFFLFLFMRAMGELLLANPHFNSFPEVAGHYLGPWAQIVVAWSYWLCWIVTGIADLVAITGYFRFWFPDLPFAIPILGVILLLWLLNALTVKAFGETEFWFAMIKIVAIVLLILAAIGLIIFGHVSPSGAEASVSNLWEHGGIFPQGFSGFVGGIQIALFAFVGLELVGTTVGETTNPEKALPKAINAVPLRVMLFYVGALAAIMMVTPWNEINPGESPFVTMFAYTGLPAAATIINLVVITSAMSSANSGIYSTARMVFGLSKLNAAPKAFGRLSKHHVPLNALTLSCCCLLAALLVMAFGDSVIGAFTVASSASASLFLVVWTFILLSYLSYAKNEREKKARSTYKMPGGVGGVYAVLVFFALVVVALFSASDTAIGLIAALIWTVFITAYGRIYQSRHPEIVDSTTAE